MNERNHMRVVGELIIKSGTLCVYLSAALKAHFPFSHHFSFGYAVAAGKRIKVNMAINI